MNYPAQTHKLSTKVLLVDDDPADLTLAKLALEKCSLAEYEVTSVGRLEQACQIAENEQFDVVLLDLGLPESSGMVTLDEFRKVIDDIPIIVLTDLIDEEAALGSLYRGAQDFLPKAELGVGSLSRSIQYAIQRHQLHNQLFNANLELKEKNHQLQQLCETAQRFVDNVSHEFRTPLTVIREYVSLLREGIVGTNPLDSEQCRFLEIVEARTDDLNTMVDDMLDVSKLESGLMGCWRKTCPANQIVERVLPAMERKAIVKEVELNVSVPSNLPALFCDPEKIGRVLINLVINAIKFSGQPGKVELSADLDASGREVRFHVRDNGPGIDEEGLALIFDRFKQLGTNIRGTSKGFGLGLNIAKELVGLNLGEMSVASKLGAGSTFSFSVPVSDSPDLLDRFSKRLHLNPASQVALHHFVIDQQEADLADDIDAVLHYLDLDESMIIRLGPIHWLVVQAKPTNDLEERVSQAIAATNRNRPHGPLPEVRLAKFSLVEAQSLGEVDWKTLKNESICEQTLAVV